MILQKIAIDTVYPSDNDLQYLVGEVMETTSLHVIKEHSTGEKYVADISFDSLLEGCLDKIAAFIKAANNVIDIDTGKTIKAGYDVIVQMLDELRKKGKHNMQTARFKQVGYLINSLQPSSDKVFLKLRYYQIGIECSYYNRKDTRDLELDVVGDVNAIVSKNKFAFYDAGVAYSYLGDYAAKYWFKTDALQNYFVALENIENDRSIDSLKRFRTLGSVYAAIAELFGQTSVKPYVEKSKEYDLLAGINYKKGNDIDGARDMLLYAVSDELWLVNTYRYFQKGSDTMVYNHSYRMEIISPFVRDYYIPFKNGTLVANAGQKSLLFNCMGEVLSAEFYDEAALRCFLLAFTFDLDNHGNGNFPRTLFNISREYRYLNNENKAIRYDDEAIELTQALGMKIEHFRALLNKASTYMSFQKFDTSLVYLRKILFDTTLLSLKDDPGYMDLITDVSHTYADIFDSLKCPDAKSLELESYKNDSMRNYDLAPLLETESQCIFNWSQRTASKSLFLEQLARRTAEQNDSLTIQLLGLSEEKGKQQRVYTDSLKKAQDSLIFVYKKLDSAYKKIDTANTKITATNTLLASRNYELTIAAILLSLLSTGLIWMYRLNDKRKREKNESLQREVHLEKKISDLSKQEAEKSQREAILKGREAAVKDMMSHEIPNIISNIKGLMNDNEGINGIASDKLEGIKKYVAEVTDYVADIYKVEGDTVSIAKEVQRAGLYARYFVRASLRNRWEVRLNQIAGDMSLFDSLKLPFGVVHSLIKNSVEHGPDDEVAGTLNVDIRLRSINSGYQLIIEDDGRGIELARKTGRSKSGKGLKLLENIVSSFNMTNEEFVIKFSSGDVYDRNKFGLKGTCATLTINQKNHET